jgi:hypothetical protein
MKAADYTNQFQRVYEHIGGDPTTPSPVGEGVKVATTPTSGGAEQLFIKDDIAGDMEPITTMQDAIKYVRENYTEGETMHPDFTSFDIYLKVGSVNAVIENDVCTKIELSAAIQSQKTDSGGAERKTAEGVLEQFMDNDRTKESIYKAMHEFAAHQFREQGEVRLSDEEVKRMALDFYRTANKHEIIFGLGWMGIFIAGYRAASPGAVVDTDKIQD